MNAHIQAAARDIAATVREMEGDEWLENDDLMRAYALACDPQTPDGDASTRELANRLINGLGAVYGADIEAEDTDGRHYGCPLRWLYFQAHELRCAFFEMDGAAWWQRINAVA